MTRQTKLDDLINNGYGMQPLERPLNALTESPESMQGISLENTPPTISEAAVAPPNGRGKASKKPAELSDDEIKDIAELKRLYLKQLINRMQAGTVKAAELAVVGKFLDLNGAFAHRPGLVKEKPVAASKAKLPFPEAQSIPVDLPFNAPQQLAAISAS